MYINDCIGKNYYTDSQIQIHEQMSIYCIVFCKFVCIRQVPICIHTFVYTHMCMYVCACLTGNVEWLQGYSKINII